MRKEVIGDCELYLGDCLEVMPELKNIDSVVTDPPYLVSKGGFGSNNQLEGGFGGWVKDYGNQGDIVDCNLSFDDWTSAVFETLKEDSQSYFMINGKNLKNLQISLEKSGFDLHTILVWNKVTALPNKYYQNITEFCLFVKKGKAFTINDPSSKNLITCFQKDESDHPTEKPKSLMSFWVNNSTKEGETVLDPFMGSGTTGVSSLNTKRKFIGIEKNEKYFDIACKRIEQETRQKDLFY